VTERFKSTSPLPPPAVEAWAAAVAGRETPAEIAPLNAD